MTPLKTIHPQSGFRNPSVNDWKNLQVVGINKRPGHTQTVPYLTAENALSGRTVPLSPPDLQPGVETFLMLRFSGAGLLATSMPVMEMSAGHYTAGDLFAAAHTYELTPRAETILNLDIQQMGLGSASCGPATLPEYLIVPGDYSFSVCLRPFTQNDPPPNKLARTALPA